MHSTKLIFWFFPVRRDLCSVHRLKCKNNVPIGWTYFKNNISCRQGSSDNFFRIDCEKILFFPVIEKPSTNHNNLVILICQSGNSSETFISDCPLMCISFWGNFIVLMMRWNHNKGSTTPWERILALQFLIRNKLCQIGFILVGSFP